MGLHVMIRKVLAFLPEALEYVGACIHIYVRVHRALHVQVITYSPHSVGNHAQVGIRGCELAAWKVCMVSFFFFFFPALPLACPSGLSIWHDDSFFGELRAPTYFCLACFVLEASARGGYQDSSTLEAKSYSFVVFMSLVSCSVGGEFLA